MRLRSIRTRGFGHTDLDIDLDQYGDARLIAVCGPIGAGKSTALELWGPGAFYRKTPTRGSLANLALTRDALLEVRCVNGQPWTLRHIVDGVNGKAEAVVLDADDRPVLGDSKLKSFDAWAASHLPDPSVLFLTTFTPQGSAGFAALSRAERMAIIGRVVANIEGLEAKSEAARAKARDWALEVARLRGRIDDAGSSDVPAAEAALAAAEHREAEAEAARLRVEQELREAQERSAAAHAARVSWTAAMAEHRRAEHRRAELVEQIAGLEQRVANNRGVLERASEIRQAVSDLDTARKALEVAESEEVSAREQAVALESKLALARQRRDEALRSMQAATRTMQLCDRRIGGGAGESEAREAEESLPLLRDACSDWEAAERGAQAKLSAIRDEGMASAEQRIFGLREGLATIALGTDHPLQVADATLRADDEVEASAKSWPERLANAEAALRTATDRLSEYRQKLARAEIVAARLKEIQAAMAEQADAKAQLAQHTRSAKEHNAECSALERSVDQAHRDLASAGAKVRLHRDRVAELTPLAAKAEPLARAEARLAELEPQLATLRDELSKTSATPAPVEPPPAPELAHFEDAVRKAEVAAREAHGERKLAAQRLDDVRERAGQVAELQLQLDNANAELADWNRLAQDLGRDGLQALEIDAGGPELSTIATDLLHSAYGPRWTLSLDTTRQSADGKRTLEDCEIRVIDTVRGREGPLESFSGGERVILGEAVSLALTTIACRNAGIERPTLVRDESGAALDVDAGRAYVAMLRRAAELIGADRVLFVSHNPEMQEMADARIVIGGAS